MERVADGFEHQPAGRTDRLAQDEIMAGQRGTHGIGVLFPQPSAADDIGEQKHHHAGEIELHGRKRGRGWHKGGARHALRRRRQPIRRKLGARAADEVVVLRRRKLELGRQQRGDLARWPARIALDLDDQVFRAADQRRQRLLRQVERFAAALDPQPER